MKITKKGFITAALYALLVATLMGLEEFYEGEMSATTVIEEILAYLSILALMFFCIVVPFQRMITKLNERFSWKGHFIQRIGIQGFVVLFLSVSLGIIFGNFIHLYIDHSLPTISVIFRTVLFLLITSSIIMTLLELRHLSDEKEDLIELSERLQQEKIESLYNALQQQVNPHFLFNSLSVLSALIHIDKAQAEQFIHHFSDVYRYVLEMNQQKLVSLQKELHFLEDYLALQQIRFGENIHLNFDLSDRDKLQYLPPLSLQLVFENILKHNTISKEKPMTIKMFIRNEELVIENTLQLKSSIHSSKIGTANLKEKYQLLKAAPPSFKEDATRFIATLPLFESEILT